MAASERGLDAVATEALSAAVLQRAADLGVSHAEIRLEALRHQYVGLRDGVLETAADDAGLGVAVRVVANGAIGFAATVDLSLDACVALVDTAVDAARRTGALAIGPIELAPEPSHGSHVWNGGERIDPTTVSLAEKVALLEAWSAIVLAHERVEHVQAFVGATAEDKYYADTGGTTARQHRVWVHPAVEALSIDAATGEFETMRTVAPPVGRGWEYLLGEQWNFEAELAGLADHLAEKMAAPTIEPGRYDLVIDPTNLWLTIHESIGHATELDRALGYEAAYAGTSFATFDKLNSLRYGSELMNVTGDRTTPFGLATIGIDDEGVEAQSFDLVRDGILVGYQLDRKIAAEVGLGRSNGCAYASSPLMTPIQRMANVSLAPAAGEGPTLEDLIAGVDRGIYIVGDKSWSIDMQRYNFQFTGQRFFRIEHGKLAGQVRDVAYQATTTDFWGSLSRLGGGSTYLLGGAVNCGKGQPGQTAPVSHGCPVALFEQVNILNTKSEAGTMTEDFRLAPADEIVERGLEAARRSRRAGDCILIVSEGYDADVRFANNTTTTNGVRRDRSIDVVRILDRAKGRAVGVASGSGPIDVATLVAAAEADAAEAAISEDAFELIGGRASSDFGAAPITTDLAIYQSLLPDLGEAFRRARASATMLSGFATHAASTVYLEQF